MNQQDSVPETEAQGVSEWEPVLTGSWLSSQTGGREVFWQQEVFLHTGLCCSQLELQKQTVSTCWWQEVLYSSAYSKLCLLFRSLGKQNTCLYCCVFI